MQARGQSGHTGKDPPRRVALLSRTPCCARPDARHYRRRVRMGAALRGRHPAALRFRAAPRSRGGAAVHWPAVGDRGARHPGARGCACPAVARGKRDLSRFGGGRIRSVRVVAATRSERASARAAPDASAVGGAAVSEVIGTRGAVHCLLCGTEGASLYSGLRDRLFSAGGEWSHRLCPAPGCGLIWLDPMPVEADIHKAYAQLLHPCGGPAARWDRRPPLPGREARLSRESLRVCRRCVVPLAAPRPVAVAVSRSTSRARLLCHVAGAEQPRPATRRRRRQRVACCAHVLARLGRGGPGLRRARRCRGARAWADGPARGVAGTRVPREQLRRGHDEPLDRTRARSGRVATRGPTDSSSWRSACASDAEQPQPSALPLSTSTGSRSIRRDTCICSTGLPCRRPCKRRGSRSSACSPRSGRPTAHSSAAARSASGDATT